LKLSRLVEQIKEKQTFLCVGLDSDVDRLPEGLSRDLDGLVEFNRAIIEATRDSCVAYKINTAFYERYGSSGWKALEKTRAILPNTHFLIADAKRGDIGNTSSYYATCFFEHLDFDALTVAPYMGRDSIEPFLGYADKHAILLGITSNPGSADFQKTRAEDGEMMFEKVLQKAIHWGSPENLMFVCGATQGAHLSRARKIAPAHFFLVPGVGYQGGDLRTVCKHALNNNIGLLVNSSRGIIYASSAKDFQRASAEKAREVSLEMKKIIQNTLI